MKDLDINKTQTILNEIMKYELAGVVKYTHFALMVTGPNRLILDKFLSLSLKNHYFMLNRLENCLLVWVVIPLK